MPKNDATQLIGKLESIRNNPLTPEEQGEIELWYKGRALAQLVGTHGWEVILEMLQSYAKNSVERLISIDPSDKENVLAEHAVAYAASRGYNIFVEDVQHAIDASIKTPEVVKNGFRNASPAPPDSL